MEDAHLNSHNKDPYPWMKKVYLVPENCIDKIKTNEDIKKLGRELSGNELEKFKRDYLRIQTKILKEQAYHIVS